MENKRGGEEWKQLQILFIWAPKLLLNVTAPIKLRLASCKEIYDQPRLHIESRDITLLSKVHIVNAMVFPVVIYQCEKWTLKKAEH